MSQRTAVLRREVDRGKATAAVSPIVRSVSVLPNTGEFFRPTKAINKGLIDFGEGLRQYAKAEHQVAQEDLRTKSLNAFWEEKMRTDPANADVYKQSIAPLRMW